jgi:hypothetical protein
VEKAGRGNGGGLDSGTGIGFSVLAGVVIARGPGPGDGSADLRKYQRDRRINRKIIVFPLYIFNSQFYDLRKNVYDNISSVPER